jgi:hypothetical protein
MYSMHEAMGSVLVAAASVWGVSFFLLLFERWLEQYRDQLAEMVNRNEW